MHVYSMILIMKSVLYVKEVCCGSWWRKKKEKPVYHYHIYIINVLSVVFGSKM